MQAYFIQNSVKNTSVKDNKLIKYCLKNGQINLSHDLHVNYRLFTSFEKQFSKRKVSKSMIQISNIDFQFQNYQIRTMNIRKIIGFGLLATLIGCEGTGKAACLEPAPQPTIYVATTTRGGSGPFVPPQHSGPIVAPPAKGHYEGHSEGHSQGHRRDSQGHNGVSSSSGHVHTDDNKAGGHPNGDYSKRHWTSSSGEPHESEESVDKEGNHHFIHRWTDITRCSHETDHWSDDRTGHTHQCHRWIDKEGITHEAVHVTNEHGKVTSEHFTKDKDGKVKKHDDDKEKHDDDKKKKEKKEKKEKESRSEDESQSHERNDKHDKRDKREPVVVVTAGSQGGSIVHSADCAASKPKPNLSTHK